jgi:SAM-dependent methyltransferase
MKLNSQDLEKIADLTLDCYNQNAEDFWEGTRYHDVSQNIAAMLQYIEGERPFTILDFGCGPGRDLKVFAELGHVAIGLEGAAQFAAMARAYSGWKYGSRISSSSIFPRTISMAYSPTPHCFMSPVRSCRACC